MPLATWSRPRPVYETAGFVKSRGLGLVQTQNAELTRE